MENKRQKKERFSRYIKKSRSKQLYKLADGEEVCFRIHVNGKSFDDYGTISKTNAGYESYIGGRKYSLYLRDITPNGGISVEKRVVQLNESFLRGGR